jgi:hypothetical protein
MEVLDLWNRGEATETDVDDMLKASDLARTQAFLAAESLLGEDLSTDWIGVSSGP